MWKKLLRDLKSVMLERPKQGELAVLVQINSSEYDAEELLAEFNELAVAAGATPVATITGTRKIPEPKYYVGSGKVAEIQAAITATQAEIVLVNHPLSPAQQRNLEQDLQCRVLDRTTLILDIFAQRARTFEGKLQVELAQLQHMASRLVRGWTHLERQRGGIGLRGPGETQLETDRRLIRTRIKHITKRLEKVRQQRAQGRRARVRSRLPAISLVGYTNTGKSTLFNKLTGSKVYVANQPFATLDPTLRRTYLPNGEFAVLADTVGFIRQLPHDLVEAFSATLEETRDADLLLHVIDAQSNMKEEQVKEVNAVLTEIEAQQVPQLLVYNKIDLIDDCEPRIERMLNGYPRRVWVSAVTGAGIDLLQQAIIECLEKKHE
jgi:GTP-binding protein HflX